jgi:hypothetical protein
MHLHVCIRVPLPPVFIWGTVASVTAWHLVGGYSVSSTSHQTVRLFLHFLCPFTSCFCLGPSFSIAGQPPGIPIPKRCSKTRQCGTTPSRNCSAPRLALRFLRFLRAHVCLFFGSGALLPSPRPWRKSHAKNALRDQHHTWCRKPKKNKKLLWIFRMKSVSLVSRHDAEPSYMYCQYSASSLNSAPPLVGLSKSAPSGFECVADHSISPLRSCLHLFAGFFFVSLAPSSRSFIGYGHDIVTSRTPYAFTHHKVL